MSISRWYSHTLEHYSTLKRIQATWTHLKNHYAEWKKIKMYILYDFIHIKCKLIYSDNRWVLVWGWGPRRLDRLQKGEENSFGADRNILYVSQIQKTVKLTEFKKMTFIVHIIFLKVDKEKKIHLATPTVTRVKLESYSSSRGHREERKLCLSCSGKGWNCKNLLIYWVSIRCLAMCLLLHTRYAI